MVSDSAPREGHGIHEVLTAPQSPWENPFAERLIGSVRRECLSHTLVLGERHLRRILTRYLAYYHQARTHLALEKDAPDFRAIELPATGRSCSFPKSAAYTIDISARLRIAQVSHFQLSIQAPLRPPSTGRRLPCPLLWHREALVSPM
jgi:Integrase core domain